MLANLIKEVPQGANGRTMLLTGKQGAGKTWQVRSLITGDPGPPQLKPLKVCFVSTERKMTSVKDLIPQHIEPFTIENFGYPDPTVSESYAHYLNHPQVNLYQIIHGLATEEHPYDVMFFDSIMRWAMNMLWETSLSNTNPDKRSDYMFFARKAKKMLDSLATITDATVVKRPVTVVATCGIETELDSIDGTKKQQAAIDGSKIAPIIGHFFDDVLMMGTEMGEGGMTQYVAHTQLNPNFDAKVSGGVKLPPKIVNPNLRRIIGKLNGELA